ncbi:MAG: serine/threonine protein kinase [Gemmatimonadetes bacterium]|nr:serine/threonine protein kinase [Gemmatimonadota bacterium]
MIPDPGLSPPGSPPEPARLICPRCRVGEVTYEHAVCGLCGYSVATGEVADDPVPPAIEDAVRRELGEQFRVDRLLGRGGMSLVYLARELELNRYVALKVLPLQLVLGPDAADRFKREAKVGAALDHPHIVPVLRIGATATFLWYSMRWAKGGSLREVLNRSGPLSLGDALSVIQPVANALYYAHQRGVIHRDVKPANVLVDDAGWVSLCDFGIAKLFGAIPLTQTGATVGTPGYIPPEQCYGHAVDGRADEYSLAMMTYECLTGSLPFTADSLGEIVRKHCMEPPPRVTDARPDLPNSVADALLRAMSKTPNDRFDTVVDFVRAMGGDVAAPPSPLNAGLVSLPDVSTSPTPEALANRARLPWVAAGLAGLVALTAVSALLTRGSPNEAPSLGARTADSLTPTEAPGLLWVNSSPWGYLSVDGRPLGATPAMRVEVPPGRHRVRISRDGFEQYEQDIEIGSGEEIRLTQIELRRSAR